MDFHYNFLQQVYRTGHCIHCVEFVLYTRNDLVRQYQWKTFFFTSDLFCQYLGGFCQQWVFKTRHYTQCVCKRIAVTCILQCCWFISFRLVCLPFNFTMRRDSCLIYKNVPSVIKHLQVLVILGLPSWVWVSFLYTDFWYNYGPLTWAVFWTFS